MANLTFNPNPSLVQGPVDFEETQQNQAIAARAPLATTYSKAEIDTLFLGFYKAVTVATKAAATAAAIGQQKKLFTVTADESQGGVKKRYLYENDGTGLSLAF